jgi:hypothetical protein
MKLLIVAIGLLVTTSAFAQESEFKAKLQEDMDSYIKQFTGSCGSTPKMTWQGGKIGMNPRETKEGDYSSISTLCTSGLEGAAFACSNAEVKKAFAKLTEVQCKRGKGTLAYTFKGNVLSIALDTAFDKNNPAGQESDLTDKIKKDLDQ